MPTFSRVLSGTIHGDIRIGGCASKRSRVTLTPGLIVTGNLDLEWSKIAELPPGLVVGGNLNVSITEIRTLPPDLRVGGDLIMRESKIREIPAGVEIGGSIDAANSKLEMLPENFHCRGDLNLDMAAMIRKLPDGLRVDGCLDLGCTHITELPARLVVTVLRTICSNLRAIRPDAQIEAVSDRSDVVDVEELLRQRGTMRP